MLFVTIALMIWTLWDILKVYWHICSLRHRHINAIQGSTFFLVHLFQTHTLIPNQYDVIRKPVFFLPWGTKKHLNTLFCFVLTYQNTNLCNSNPQQKLLGCFFSLALQCLSTFTFVIFLLQYTQIEQHNNRQWSCQWAIINKYCRAFFMLVLCTSSKVVSNAALLSLISWKIRFSHTKHKSNTHK